MIPSSSLIRVLAGLVVQHDWFFESCDDSVLAPEDALKQLEWSAHVLGGLSEPDRQAFVTLVSELAAEETDPALREFMNSYTFYVGLTDSDD